jgi:hypothetical protein
LRARPEQTQLKDLSDASFLGKLLVLPANVRLEWKVIAMYKHSSLFGLIISDEEKRFYIIDNLCQSFKTFSSSSLIGPNKLVHHFSWPGFTPKYKAWLERVAMDQCSKLFGLNISDEEQSFITLTPGVNLTKIHCLCWLV